MLVRKLSFDKTDRVFFVGDVHGRYSLLMEQLDKAMFSPENGDTLISVGDLIDSGSECDLALGLLDKPWFKMVMGNHEWLMNQATKDITQKDFDRVSSFLIDRNGLQKLYDLRDGIALDDVAQEIDDALTREELNWTANGGAWFYDVFEVKGFAFRKAQAVALDKANLPLAIEVDHPMGLVGVVHAGIKSNNWGLVGAVARFRPQQLMWMRDHINGFESGDKTAYEAGFVKGVDALVVGHSVSRRRLPLIIANTMYIDVNAKGGFAPFVIEIIELINATSKNIK